MKKILIVAPFCSLPGEQGFNRFLYLADLLSKRYDVTLLTSSFRHSTKSQREQCEDCYPYKVKVVFAPSYSSNVSLKRIFSHRVFFKNFKDWFMRNGTGFDLVYSAYPLISTNVFLVKNKNLFNYKLIVDVQDVWPESISAAFPFVKNFPLWMIPYTRQADFCYKGADALVAVSKTYLDRAMLVCPNTVGAVAYIGSDSDKIESAPILNLDKRKLKLVYIGSLGYSYDIKTVVLAVNEMIEAGLAVELHIFGGGHQESELKTVASQDVKFHGYVDYDRMISFVKACDLGVNALKASAPQSITNKLSDYFSVGIPMLNSQVTEELHTLYEGYPHVSYSAGSVDSCKAAIARAIGDPSFRKKYPKDIFFRKNCYSVIEDIVLSTLDLTESGLR